MKKTILILSLLFSQISFGQWAYEKVNNGLDDPYKIAYNKNQFGDVLKMEQFKEGVILYVQDETICQDEEDIDTDLSFFVNGQWIRYTFECNIISEDAVGLVHNLFSQEDILKNFKACTKIKFRYNYVNCESESYEFNMQGSTKAINYMIN